MQVAVGFSREDASRILSAGFGQATTALEVVAATGGMVSSVWIARLDRAPYHVVLKVSDQAGAFAGECRALEFLHRRTRFPVPAVLFHLDPVPDSETRVLALEWVDGIPLGEASLPPAERARLEMQIAHAVSDLHTHTRPEFGNLEGTRTSPRWADIFRPRLAAVVAECEGRTEPTTLAVARRVVERLDQILAERVGPARLIHGDLWANNILVDPRAPGGTALRAFIDPGAEYADPEAELAYLEVFRTVGANFFTIYRQQHAIDPGYPARRAIYHLHTMLVHIWLFGDAVYHQRAAALAASLAATV